MKPGKNRVGENTIYIMPAFIHEFGYFGHHGSMMRTCEIDEDGYVPGTGFPEWSYVVHEFLDDWVFYPISRWLRDWIGDNELYSILRSILGFFWGISCHFPPRDVVLYTVWTLRGCAPIAVFEKGDGGWEKTYPASEVRN